MSCELRVVRKGGQILLPETSENIESSHVHIAR